MGILSSVFSWSLLLIGEVQVEDPFQANAFVQHKVLLNFYNSSLDLAKGSFGLSMSRVLVQFGSISGQTSSGRVRVWF